MSFWSGETLELRLPKLVTGFDASRIDCNAYTLRIGEQYFVTPADKDKDARTRTRTELKPEQSFTIPPGQFALVLTEEEVSVPSDAMAFISMKAKVKMSGIVNVSGFHVDPGFKGKLTFALFNAGPSIVHFQRGQECFLIWYASLDHASAFHKRANSVTNIPIQFINGFTERLYSLSGLSERLDKVEDEFKERTYKIEKEHTFFKYVATLLLGAIGVILSLVLSLVGRWAWIQLQEKNDSLSRISYPHVLKYTERMPDAEPSPKNTAPVVPAQEIPPESAVPQEPCPEPSTLPHKT